MSGPLDGVRVLVLRPEHQAGSLAGRIEQLGGAAVVVPAIRILPPESWTKADEAITRAPNFDWIVFTSVNGVRSLLGRLEETGSDIATLPERVGAIGPGTRKALEDEGLEVHWVPNSYTSAAVAQELPDPPGKVLLVRADIATNDLDEALEARGFSIARIDAYRTETVNGDRIRDAISGVDMVALTSASIARSFANATGPGTGNATPALCSIGPATSAECERLSLPVASEATEHTIPGLLTAMAELAQGG